ncbi:flavodoxin-dependent (E)-4-hydroxy-3-methylbut-2-enyl-diphosphate synthase [Candidatus Woesearchaeota archaeon]|nr:flavodoxin-dependent (E)-4-hydroxy-3-methylbut-2-enyl-diphosphate synthase [Candidatus Woesearchaeota archaeon]
MKATKKNAKIGEIILGEGHPVRIQSMCNTVTTDIKSTLAQAKSLEKAGCEILRFGIPDQESIKALSEIRKHLNIPVVADIHFDYKLAIASCVVADKIRVNPGNLGGTDRLKTVIEAAKKHNTCIRIGVNAGSLEKRFNKIPIHEALVHSAMDYIRVFEEINFENIVVSLKSSDVQTSVKAYRLFREKSGYPLHVGITESGSGEEGIIKSAAGIGALLVDGIGDTIRVSLSDDPVREIEVAQKIVQAVGLRQFGPEYISCPTCARSNIDVISVCKKTKESLIDFNRRISIAVMGCEVNGPGEAAHADIGLAAGKDRILIFEKGKIVERIDNTGPIDQIIELFVDRVRKFK